MTKRQQYTYKYNHSPKGIAARKRYLEGAGKEVSIKSQARWKKSIAGKEARKRERAKLKNIPFEIFKTKARSAINKAVLRGKIIKKSCVICGSVKTEAHHTDYSKLLEVTWLCGEHHRHIHRTAERQG